MSAAFGGLLSSPILATVYLLIPGLPQGLAFATMFATILGALVAAPFPLIVLAAVTTQIGALQVALVAVAVLTAYLAVSGSGVLMALAQSGRTTARSSSKARDSPHRERRNGLRRHEPSPHLVIRGDSRTSSSLTAT